MTVCEKCGGDEEHSRLIRVPTGQVFRCLDPMHTSTPRILAAPARAHPNERLTFDSLKPNE